MWQSVGICIEYAIQATQNHFRVNPTCFTISPEQFGQRNCIKDIDVNDLDIAEEYAEQRPAMGCDESFAELASMIMEDHHYTMPCNEKEAYSLYVNLMHDISEINHENLKERLIF